MYVCVCVCLCMYQFVCMCASQGKLSFGVSCNTILEQISCQAARDKAEGGGRGEDKRKIVSELVREGEAEGGRETGKGRGRVEAKGQIAR